MQRPGNVKQTFANQGAPPTVVAQHQRSGHLEASEEFLGKLKAALAPDAVFAVA
jgi:hypothetical protein